MDRRHYVELDADPQAPGRARRTVAQALTGREPELVASAVLAVSELVSNAVRHGAARGSIGVGLVLREDGLRVEVSDTGDGFEPAPLPADGFGLRIVEGLSASWGVERGPPHLVWCELSG